MNKQIEKMAQVYEEARYKAQETLGSMNKGAGVWYASAFYNAGYRRQEDVAREIFEEIERNIFKIITPYNQALQCLPEGYIAELKKKYGVIEE